MISAEEALNRLKEGNARFASGVRSEKSLQSQSRRETLLDGQAPFAIILGCSDSRAPAELLFDQGLGDLFVIRVAGNIVAPSQIGSVEFAASKFGTPLVVVLGHSRCGAVQATLEEIQKPTENQSPNLHSIVKRVKPAIKTLLETNPGKDLSALASEAVRANVRVSVDKLASGSEILETLILSKKLLIVGAEYLLETGQVEFLS